MVTNNTRCALVTIHGIGNQPSSWSQDFDTALAGQLTPAERDEFAHMSVRWSDLSRGPGTPATAAFAPAGHTGTTAVSQAYVDYASYLARGTAGAVGGPAGLGSVIGGVVNKVMHFKDGPVSLADQVTDVANYVGNNKVRLAVQERLTAALFAMQAAHPQAALIVGSHSQGTIIAYDVLRLIAGHLPTLRVWVSMGCPLAWYLSGASWGDNELTLPAALRWVNLYDRTDVVGQDLDRLASWTPVVPQDIDVDNAGQGLDPHDHWHNPVVVAKYAELIRGFLS